MNEDLEDLRAEIVGRLRDAALRAQDERFDRAAHALDGLHDERAWRAARRDLAVPLIAAGWPRREAPALIQALAIVEST